MIRGLNENSKDDDAGKNIILSILCNKIFHRQFLCEPCDRKMRETAWLQFIKNEVMNNTDPSANSSKREETFDSDGLIHKKVRHVKEQDGVWGVVDTPCSKESHEHNLEPFALGVGGDEVDVVEEEDGGMEGEIDGGESGDEGEGDDGEDHSEEEVMDGEE